MSAELTSFFDTPAIRLTHNDYQAVLLPEMGANLVSLEYKNLHILNCPSSTDALRRSPYSYGIPLLCPPNRIKNARFCYKGHMFQFSSNLPEGAILHGVLHRARWTVEELGTGESGSWVKVSCSGKENEEIRNGFGPEVSFEVTYILSDEGLKQTVTIQNDTSWHIPFGLAFHTAFAVPFHPCSKKESVYLKMPLKTRCRLNSKDFYPDRIDDELYDYEKSIAGNGYPPLQRQIDMLYKRDLQRPNEVCLMDTDYGYCVHYKADDAYKYWIIWNDTAQEGFVGLEPQTWLSNAPYYWQEGERDHGIIDVMPGTRATLATQIWVERL